jgi:glycine/D-amino acid oxidase-like deaminating enzyme
MDIQLYYQKIRQLEARIEEPFAVVVSLETQDGGRPGVCTEASRFAAARLVVDGKARLASAEETSEFRKQLLEQKRAAEEIEAGNRLQVTLVHEVEPSGNKILKIKK